MAKRFGPTLDAGVAVIEKKAAGSIQPASLGVTGHVGIYEKGVPGTLIQALSAEEFTRKMGGRIPESMAPDAALDFYELSRGAGFLNMVRVTAGNEVKSEKTFYSRQAVRAPVMKVVAKSGGRWAGRFAEFVDEYVAATATTLDTGRVMLEDQYVGAIVTFDALPGRSYVVVSNDEAGILTFASDSTLSADLADSDDPSNLLYNVKLANLSTQVVEVEIDDGTDNPSTEFRVKVYEDDVLVRDYDNLSNDPNAANYFVPTINDDGANEYIEVEDLNSGEPTAAKRPANFYKSASKTLTALTLTTDIADHVDNSVNSAKSVIVEALGAQIIPDVVTLTNTAAGARATGTVEIINNTFNPAVAATATITIVSNTFDAGDKVTIRGVDFEQGVDFVVGGDANATASNLATAINNSLNSLIDTEVSAVAVLNVVTLTASPVGAVGNTYTLAETDPGTDNFTISGATFTGGFDGDSVTVAGEKFYFGVGLDVVPGATAALTAQAFADAINANEVTSALVFAEVLSGAIVTITALTAGTAGNSIALVEDDGGTDNFTLSGATLSGGVAQTWSYASEQQPYLSGTVTSGVAFAAPNAYAFGLTVKGVAGPAFALADTIVIDVKPFPVNGLVGGTVIPDIVGDPDVKFEIVSNTANSVTVRTGSDMTVLADAGDAYLIVAPIGLVGGYDGIADIVDQDYIDAYSSVNSPFNELFGQNVGLVKLGTPGVTSVAVQKAGAEYANGRNYEYRHEIPSNVTTEVGAYDFMANQVGKSDLSVVSFPSFVYVTNPDGAGLKLVSAMGMIHGREALVAKNFDGYHKAAAGLDVTLPRVLKLPTGDKDLNGEFLNPRGINRIRKKEGNFILWGDRMFTNDTEFKFKHTREYMSHVENILRENFDYIIFALNNTDEQSNLHTTLLAFFIPEFAKGAIVGEDVADAARIKIDSENNTPATQAQGDMNAEINLAIVDTVERLIITIGKQGIFDRSA